MRRPDSGFSVSEGVGIKRNMTRGNGFKLREEIEVRQKEEAFYSKGGEILEPQKFAPSLAKLKARLDGALSSLILLQMSLFIAGE